MAVSGKVRHSHTKRRKYRNEKFPQRAHAKEYGKYPGVFRSNPQ